MTKLLWLGIVTAALVSFASLARAQNGAAGDTWRHYYGAGNFESGSGWLDTGPYPPLRNGWTRPHLPLTWEEQRLFEVK